MTRKERSNKAAVEGLAQVYGHLFRPRYIPANAQNVCAPDTTRRGWYWQEKGLDHYCVATVPAGKEANTGYGYTLSAPETGAEWALIEVGQNAEHIRWLWRQA